MARGRVPHTGKGRGATAAPSQVAGRVTSALSTPYHLNKDTQASQGPLPRMLSEHSEWPPPPHGLGRALLQSAPMPGRPLLLQPSSGSAQVLPCHLRTQGPSEKGSSTMAKGQAGPKGPGALQGLSTGHTCPRRAPPCYHVTCFPRLLQVHAESFSLTIDNQRDASRVRGQGV